METKDIDDIISATKPMDDFTVIHKYEGGEFLFAFGFDKKQNIIWVVRDYKNCAWIPMSNTVAKENLSRNLPKIRIETPTSETIRYYPEEYLYLDASCGFECECGKEIIVDAEGGEQICDCGIEYDMVAYPVVFYGNRKHVKKEM